MKVNKYIKKSLKIFGWIIVGIISLILLLLITIQIPAIQNSIKNKAVNYLEEKIKTPVKIEKIEIGFPKKIILNNVYFQSQIGDTLFSGEKVAVNLSLFKLFNDEIEINSISLKNTTANVKRNKDSIYNFDYIIDAFSSKTPKSNQKEMKFSIHDIRLENIRVYFDDAITKNNFNISLNHLETKIKEFDLKKMDYEIPKIKLNGLKANLKQGELLREIATNTVVKTDSIIKKRPDLNIKLGKIDLSNIQVTYDNAGTKLNSGLSLSKLFIDFKKTNLPKQEITINKLELNGLKGGLTLGKLDRKLDLEKLPRQSTPKWQLFLSDVNIKNVDFRFDDENSPKISKGIDYNHINVQQLQLEAKNLNYTSNPNVFSGNIEAFTVKEQSGFNIKKLQTHFAYTAYGVQLKKLFLKTNKTFIQNQITIQYPSLQALKTNPGSLAMNADLQKSHVAFNDILLFVPDLAQIPFFKNNANSIAHINGQIKGKLNDLMLPYLDVSGIGSSSISVSGRIIGLPNTEKAWYNLNIKNLYVSAQDIDKSVKKGTLPTSIQLPQNTILKGTFKGKLNNFDTNFTLISSLGNAQIKANFDNRIKNAEKYNGVIALDNFDLGKLIKDASIGKITLKANMNGTGLSPKSASARLNGFMQKGVFNNYTYQNLALNGKITNGLYTASAKIKDPNLEFDLTSNGNFNASYPEVNMKMNIAIADLQKLNFNNTPLKFRGEFDVKMTSASVDHLNGILTAKNLLLVNEKGQFPLDSIHITATSTAEKNTLQLQSQFIKANVFGKYQLNEIVPAITNSINKYYAVQPATTIKTKPQNFNFDVTISEDPIIMKLISEIKQVEPININGRYNSANDTIVLNAKVPKLIYGENIISNGIFKINTNDDSLVYNATLGEIQNVQFRLPNTQIEGSVKDNLLTYQLQLRDEKDKDQYIIAGTVKADNGNTKIHLSPQDLMLNYEKWSISENNLIRLSNNGIYANEFVLKNGNSTIALQSQFEKGNSPLILQFNDFNIETISRAIQKESLAFGGIMNGEATIENIKTQPVFVSDITIKNFTYKKENVGDISVKVNNKVANTYAIETTITGQGNDAKLHGIYQNTNKSFDLNLDLKQLNLISIQPFTQDQLTKSSGYLSGKFHIKGNLDQPKIIGELKFNDGAFTVTKLNSAFELLNDKITFTEERMEFKNFSLSDSDKNILLLRGKIVTSNYSDFAFNLRVNGNNFRVTNSTAKDNDLYYGKLYIDTNLTIKGNQNKPIIDGNIKVNENTELTIVLPQSNPSITDREGIVEFIDQDAPQIDKRLLIATDSISQTKFKSMNVSATIEIDKDAELTMIIDKGNGDYLKLKGEAQLTGGIDESGKTTLTGRYELKEGTYEMTFNYLKRKFEINEGSYILWTGEPTTANINITAVYETKTAPIDLLDDQLGNISPAVRNTYKQRIPFETHLKMKGELLKPEITFDIILPEGNYNVSSEIVSNTRTKLEQLRQQPDELNKQVFALLLLNRFIGENPFSSESHSGTESIVRQSVSKMMSQQLNNLAGNLIEGVELDFDLEASDDYTTGTRENRTDLNVGVSKRLLDDKLKVTVGSSFGIEGPVQANRETTNIAGDVSLDYQLSKDGRYMLRAYRKNEYQVALQGQIIETGVAFIITMDYNKFKELFHHSEEEKEMINNMKKKKRREKREENIKN
ncbi:translocation/assembly module TamB domain-containing protein [Flavobacterium sp.]|uniref:translocation/assembly module TamB domain-containing protein n=1 Tax=Flavobacterium sp. TaxID=239 RepID=UPI003FA550A6